MTDRCLYSRCSQPRADDSTYGLCTRHEKNARRVLGAQVDTRKRESRAVQRYRTGDCADCGARARLVGRGLCRPCYKRHHRQGNLTKFKRAKWTT